jgi:hypothetical protein
MHPILRNISAIVFGISIGMVVNMSLVTLGPDIVPPPEGSDITTLEGLKSAMPYFTPLNFLFPFLGHALGTLVGAFIASVIAGDNKLRIAFVIGFFFFLGGISMVILVPSPLWFSILDLVVAYIPMSYLGYWLYGKSNIKI